MKSAIMFAIKSTILDAANAAVHSHARNFRIYNVEFEAEYIDSETGRFTVNGADCGLRFYNGKAVIA